ncbi:hypothetical protein HispidOSU_019519 [Sigmodon hispidus]
MPIHPTGRTSLPSSSLLLSWKPAVASHKEKRRAAIAASTMTVMRHNRRIGPVISFKLYLAIYESCSSLQSVREKRTPSAQRLLITAAHHAEKDPFVTAPQITAQAI